MVAVQPRVLKLLELNVAAGQHASILTDLELPLATGACLGPLVVQTIVASRSAHTNLPGWHRRGKGWQAVSSVGVLALNHTVQPERLNLLTSAPQRGKFLSSSRGLHDVDISMWCTRAVSCGFCPLKPAG